MSKWKDRDLAWAKRLDELVAKWVGIPVPIDALEYRRDLNRCKCEVKTTAVHIPELGLYGASNGWLVTCHACGTTLLHWRSKLWAHDLECYFNPKERNREY